MQLFIYYIFLISALLGLDKPEEDHANNRYRTGDEYLSIKHVEQNEKKLTLEVSWSCSWRDDENWDAVWIFLKDGSGKSLRIDEVSAPSSAEVHIPKDSIGFFVYQKSPGDEDAQWRLQISLNDDGEITSIHGLEMVYIPQGPFELGTVKSFSDRNNISTSRGSKTAPLDAFFTYKSGAEDGFGGVYKIKNEQPISIGKEDGNLYYTDAVIPGTNTFSGDKKGVLPQAFPKGYDAFYQMKYELTEQQYCDFLNNLPAKLAKKRFDLSASFQGMDRKAHRNAIYLKDGIYKSSRPNRACNFLSWKDVLAYADWSGLRPMTELEFEKSARGPKKAVWREFVWGVNEVEAMDNFKFTTTIYDPNKKIALKEDGDEYVDGNAHLILLNYGDYQDVCEPTGEFYQPTYPYCRNLEGGDSGRGPLRVGIHGVNSGGSRIASGASYYGAMDLGGNLQEPVIPVGSPFTRLFEGSHGDGTLGPEGEATNPDWKATSDEQYVFGFRGGSWPYHENHARIADRFDTYRTGPNERKPYRGFRGVRSIY